MLGVNYLVNLAVASMLTIVVGLSFAWVVLGELD